MICMHKLFGDIKMCTATQTTNVEYDWIAEISECAQN